MHNIMSTQGGTFVKLFGSILLLKVVSCANILIAEDLASPSHQIWNYAIADALVARGYNVTVLGPQTIPIGQNKFHFIPLEGLAEATINSGVYQPDLLTHLSMIGNIQLFHDFSVFACNYSLHTKGLRRLIDYPADFKFDLIILDLTVTPCFSPLIERFDTPPAVAITAYLLPQYLSELFGNSFPVSYLPYILSKNEARMNFFGRLHNFIFSKLDLNLRTYYTLPMLDRMSREVYGDDMQSLDTLGRKIAFLLCNLSPGFHYSQPITPNIIPVGGLHIDTKKKLPQDLQDIMDSAKHGVVLFSLGSNIRSDTMCPEKKNLILKAFSQLNQTVLWKFESTLTDLPKNVVTRKWIPQTELLAHPNLKLFITHGGGLSTIESAFYGVPMIGIPFFIDQHSNMELVVTRELGLKLDYNTLTSTNLLGAINEILTNQKYSGNARKISSIMRDQPQTPMERALFWIEFALRSNGTKIYDPQSRYLSDFILSSFDVYLFSLLIFSLFVYFSYKIVAVLSHILNWNREKVKTN